MTSLRHTSRSRSDAGFTLAEVLVALVLSAIVVTQVLAILSSQQTLYVQSSRVVDTQEDARLVADMIANDLLMAGFMVPAEAGLASRDGGTGGSDVLCASDPNAIDPLQLGVANSRFDRATLAAALGASTNSVTLAAGELDVDADGNDDFAVGAGIIVSDGTRSHCAEITAIAGNAITFAPVTPSGFTIAASSGRATPASIYEITASGLERNSLVLSPLVEDLQVEFGVDANGDNQLTGAEFPVHDLNGTGSDPSQIRTVRLSVIARATVADSTSGLLRLPQAANRNAGPVDGFHRRRVTTRVVPRNLM